MSKANPFRSSLKRNFPNYETCWEPFAQSSEFQSPGQATVLTESPPHWRKTSKPLGQDSVESSLFSADNSTLNGENSSLCFSTHYHIEERPQPQVPMHLPECQSEQYINAVMCRNYLLAKQEEARAHRAVVDQQAKAFFPARLDFSGLVPDEIGGTDRQFAYRRPLL